MISDGCSLQYLYILKLEALIDDMCRQVLLGYSKGSDYCHVFRITSWELLLVHWSILEKTKKKVDGTGRILKMFKMCLHMSYSAGIPH